MGVSEHDAKSIHSSIGRWTDEKYADIRRFQNGGVNGINSALSKDVEKYIKGMPKYNGKRVYRGLEVLDSSKTHFANMKKGQVIDMQGTSSWTSKADIFSNLDVQIHLKNPKSGVSVQHISEFDDEYELLFSRDTKFKVLKVEEKKIGRGTNKITQININVEEILPNWFTK